MCILLHRSNLSNLAVCNLSNCWWCLSANFAQECYLSSISPFFEDVLMQFARIQLEISRKFFFSFNSLPVFFDTSLQDVILQNYQKYLILRKKTCSSVILHSSYFTAPGFFILRPLQLWNLPRLRSSSGSFFACVKPRKTTTLSRMRSGSLPDLFSRPTDTLLHDLLERNK